MGAKKAIAENGLFGKEAKGFIKIMRYDILLKEIYYWNRKDRQQKIEREKKAISKLKGTFAIVIAPDTK